MGKANGTMISTEVQMESLFLLMNGEWLTHTSTSKKSKLPLPRACVGYTNEAMQALKPTLIKD